MEEICSLCEGSGLRIVEEGGRQVARACECRIERRVARMLERARIPRLYEQSTLDNYEIGFRGADKSLKAARLIAQGFVNGFPVQTEGRGLLLTGSVGVGKTHLAIAILRTLITSRGASGLFYTYPDLLREVMNTYNRQVAIAEMEVLLPVFNAEVLVLDEFGAFKPSEWVSDTVAHILNTRYNERRTTIITTNFPNLEELPKADWAKLSETQQAVRVETLGDRIGERMRSRLQEMCVTVEMYGKDFRKNVKPAHFATDTKGAIATPALLDESITAIPEPAQECPLVGPDRLGAWAGGKLAVAAAEVQISSKLNNPNATKVVHNGVLEDMLTGGAHEDECIDATPEPKQERPLIGRDRMGNRRHIARDVKID